MFNDDQVAWLLGFSGLPCCQNWCCHSDIMTKLPGYPGFVGYIDDQVTRLPGFCGLPCLMMTKLPGYSSFVG